MSQAAQLITNGNVSEYWSDHNVTLHKRFSSPEESLAYLAWRNDQYPGYIDLMPVAGHDGKRILDYGCGPGHDLVGFCHHSREAKVVGIDVSFPSLEEAASRLNLHSHFAELVHIGTDTKELPFASKSFDLVHSSGVLHHTPDPVLIMRELHRVLADDGEAQIMVYNYESLWLHLYVAFIKMATEGRYKELDIREAFARTTDGEDCPIARPYRPSEFAAMCEQVGFEVVSIGCAASAWELHLFARRFEAIMNPELRPESRQFLLNLTIDERGIPHHDGLVAGVDLCLRLKKK
ncbi:class I SAM-dependent methyltransferase [Microvirga alba]|uniref:Class I SAM-dependent methyltransferase n=1 Tax=Microvirga alba TaxID=2791025 RepID=A0A931BLD8_9HYPH|nr:class I SAM-dependent methyltransferase [Microvirga alba]MBF9231973.1 class I SAM-dependent methyltransferase [Microvirga alba]